MNYPLYFNIECVNIKSLCLVTTDPGEITQTSIGVTVHWKRTMIVLSISTQVNSAFRAR